MGSPAESWLTLTAAQGAGPSVLREDPGSPPAPPAPVSFLQCSWLCTRSQAELQQELEGAQVSFWELGAWPLLPGCACRAGPWV